MKIQIKNLLAALLLLALPAVAQAQFTYTTNNGAIIITGHTIPLTNIVVPASINGYLVTIIGDNAFRDSLNLTNAMIPNSITYIGENAFFNCPNLASMAISDSVTSIGNDAFEADYGLTNLTIGNSVTNIGDNAIRDCTNLTDVIIPASVTSIGMATFAGDLSLTNVTFLGNAPGLGNFAFAVDAVGATAYYYPGTSGWSSTYGGIPTVLWNPQVPAGNGNLGIKNGQFGFNLTGPTNATIVVEASTNLSTWIPVSTNIFSSSGTSSFSDPQWTNYPGRYYRFRAP
jgi:BspA type Leucine rich repeat region (6 copies)